MMRVLVVLCALAAMALAENAETSVKESPLYDDVLEQCKMMFGRCLQEARGNPIRIIQCSGQFGVCSTMTLVGCSKQCIPPLLLCNIGALGNWIATFKCCADFIKCAIGGCVGPHGSTPAFSLEDKSEERAQDIMIESFVTSLPESTPDYGLIKECKIMLDECNSLADGKIDRLKCFIQFGACLAAKTVDCGKKCIPPLTECRMAAKSKGSIADLIKCSIDFLQCMTGGCEEEYTVMDIDDYSPFETAVDLAILSETDNGIIEHFKQCKAAHTKCLETAAPGIKGKAQCFLKFGWCCATGVTGCSASCMPGMAICMMGAVGNWVKTFLCAANFVKCIKDQCISTQELALTSTAVELRNIRYDFATCKSAHEQCLAGAGSLPAKVRCWLVFGACVGKDLAHCAGGCMPGFAICMMGATGDWLKVMSCATNFVKCAKDECFKNELTVVSTAVEVPNVDIIAKFKECKAAHDQCMDGAGAGFPSKVKCWLGFGACIGKDLVHCAGSCMPGFAICMMGATGDWMKVMSCATNFVKCAKTECLTDKLAVTSTDVEVRNIHISYDFATCKAAHDQCLAGAASFPDQVRCWLGFGTCVGKDLIHCAGSCMPGFAICMMGATGDMMKVMACAKNFITCAKDECFKNEITVVSTAVEVPNVDIIAKFKECKAAHDQCIDGAGAGFPSKVKCWLQFGACIGKDLVHCAGSCMPGFAICMMGATGDWMKVMSCATNFVKCAKTECLTDQLAVTSTAVELQSIHISYDFATCKAAHDQCLAGAGSFPDQVRCWLGFGTCVGKDLIHCAGSCMPGFAICMMGATGDMMKVMACAKNFITCAKDECFKNELTVAPTALELPNIDIVAEFKKCKAAHDECMDGAGDGLKDKAVCWLKFGTCVGKQLALCAGPCMPNMAICMMGATGNWMKVMACATSFVKCSKDKCLTNELAVTSTDIELRHIHVTYDFAACKAAHDQCLAAAGSLPDQVRCWLGFGTCVGKDLVHCAGSCMPGFAICMMGATGDWMKVMSCAKNFITCAKDQCFKNELTVEPYAVELPNIDIIAEFKKCKATHGECMDAAGDGLKDKAVCWLKFGTCVGKQLAICTGPCMPNMAICMMGATGNWKKVMACAVSFIKCSKGKCLTNEFIAAAA